MLGTAAPSPSLVAHRMCVSRHYPCFSSYFFFLEVCEGGCGGTKEKEGGAKEVKGGKVQFRNRREHLVLFLLDLGFGSGVREVGGGGGGEP